MKKFITALALSATVFTAAHAQEESRTSNWTLKSVAGLNASYTGLVNWAAGGENTLAWNIYLNAAANYKKDKWSWDNALVADYGLTHTDATKWQKSLDKLNISSKAGYAISKTWNASFLADFLTQFAEGHKDAKSKNAGDMYISKFMSPGYLTSALGFDYKPNDSFSLFLSPTTGKFTFVTDAYLSDKGAYGVKPGKKALAEFGSLLVANYNKQLAPNFSVISKLSLFSAYNNKYGNIDVNWDVMLAYKLNKFLSTTLTTNLIYDDDVKSVAGGPKVQFRHVFGVGLTYSL